MIAMKHVAFSSFIRTIALAVGLHLLVSCSMFRGKETAEGRSGTSAERTDIVRTGMSPNEVERLLGKPDNVAPGPCTIAGQTQSCQVWRYTKRRQSTLWFTGESAAARLELFDLEVLR
jgi:hypothetical protein